jgi:hypothetical protein
MSVAAAPGSSTASPMVSAPSDLLRGVGHTTERVLSSTAEKVLHPVDQVAEHRTLSEREEFDVSPLDHRLEVRTVSGKAHPSGTFPNLAVNSGDTPSAVGRSSSRDAIGSQVARTSVVEPWTHT